MYFFLLNQRRVGGIPIRAYDSIWVLLAICIMYVFINNVNCMNCKTLEFGDLLDFKFFKGDFRPNLNESNLKIQEATSYNSREIILPVIFENGLDSGTVSFYWKKDGAHPDAFNLSFYFDDIPIDENCKNIGYWGTEPFYRKIENNGALNHTLKWILKHDDSKICIGPAHATAFIDELELCGMRENGHDDPINNNLIFKNESFSPNNGSILCPFDFSVRLNDPIDSSMVELWALNPSRNIWENKGIVPIDEINKTVIFKNIKFDSSGRVKYRFVCGSRQSNSYDGPEVYPLDVNFFPSEGCNLNPYTFLINKSIPNICDVSDISLVVKDPYSSEWKNLGKGHVNQRDIAFDVSDLNFTDPFLGDVECGLERGGKIIKSFKGPHIYLNYRNLMTVDCNTYSAQVRSERYGEKICITIDNGQSFTNTYTTRFCQWQTLIWHIPGFCNNKQQKVGSCIDG